MADIRPETMERITTRALADRFIEEQLAEMHELFIDVVAENRGLDEAKVREIADGRTFLASKALEYGLIDGIGYYDYAQYSMIVDCNLAENVTFYDEVVIEDWAFTKTPVAIP